MRHVPNVLYLDFQKLFSTDPRQRLLSYVAWDNRSSSPPEKQLVKKAERTGINGQFIVGQNLPADFCRDLCLALRNHTYRGFEKVK